MSDRFACRLVPVPARTIRCYDADAEGEALSDGLAPPSDADGDAPSEAEGEAASELGSLIEPGGAEAPGDGLHATANETDPTSAATMPALAGALRW